MRCTQRCLQNNLPHFLCMCIDRNVEIIPHYQYDILYVNHNQMCVFSFIGKGGRRSPAVGCWASDHWVAGLNLFRGKFRH